jgi:hypothetical protein
VDTSLLEKEDVLIRLNKNSCASALNVEEKCKKCRVFSSCPHCAADCVNEVDGTVTKTTSVCNFHKIGVYYAQLYWEKVTALHPYLYRNYKVTWTREDREELMRSILEEVVNMKNKSS